MGKFLKRAGSLLMVPLLPGRGWQEPAGCWMCWQPPGAKGSWWEQMPGLGWLLPSHSLRPRRQMAASKTAGVAVLCFPGGGIANNKKHLNPQAHHMAQDRRGWHTHTLCAPTAHVRPVVPWLVREKSSRMENQLMRLLFTAYKCRQPNLILYFHFLQVHKSRRDCMQK